MRKPNKNKMAGVNSRVASVSESIFNGFLLKMLLRLLSVYILKQLFFLIPVNSGRIFTDIFCHYSPRFQRIIVKCCATHYQPEPAKNHFKMELAFRSFQNKLVKFPDTYTTSL